MNSKANGFCFHRQAQLVIYHLPLYNCNLILTLYITVSELTFILQQLGCHQYTVNSHVSPHPHRSEVTEAFSPRCSSYWAQLPPGIIIHLNSPVVLLQIDQHRVNTPNKSEMNDESRVSILSSRNSCFLHARSKRQITLLT